MEPGFPPDLLVGKMIGNYVVRAKLGEGGMGSVYLAEHPTIGKKVALKVLHAEFASRTDIITRFFTEAKTVNDIQHPNIVDIIDFGALPTGPSGAPIVYFIMELLPGGTLADVIRRDAPLPLERAIGIARQISEALSAAHKHGVVHRDLKPDNVMLIERGRDHDFVKLLDFGIAKLTSDQAPASQRTRTGMLMGTPGYMSPEQCQGSSQVDHRTDIYALGIVLFEMLTGRVPFLGDGFGEVMMQHMTQPPLAPSSLNPQIPPELEHVILKALAKRPDARYSTVDDMILALADPVGYVERHGGLSGLAAFQQTTVAASHASLPTIRLLPQPMLENTTRPSATTTLGGAALQVDVPATAPRSRRRAGVWLGGGLAVAVGLGLTAYVKQRSAVHDAVDERQAPVTIASSPRATQATPSPQASGPGVSPPPASPTPSPEMPVPPPPVPSPGAASQTAPAQTSVAQSTPPPAPTAAKVHVEILSTPSGALVFFGNEPKPRGSTPFRQDLEPAHDAVRVKLVLAGHDIVTKNIRLDADAALDVELPAAPSRHVPAPPPKAKPQDAEDHNDSNDVKDPFAKLKKGGS